MIARYGERAVMIQAADSVHALELAHRLRHHEGVADVIPAAKSVVLTFNHSPSDGEIAAIAEHVTTAPGSARKPAPSRMVEIPVTYDGDDLAAVAAATGLSVAEVVELHSSTVYRAAFAGFAPGFVYLEGLPQALQIPRRDTPRTSVPAGSLALAATYTAIYPRRSPGGWHLIGTTTQVVFDPTHARSALIEPGDRVRFLEVRR